MVFFSLCSYEHAYTCVRVRVITQKTHQHHKHTDTLDNACFGQMKMYFHTGFTDFILWDTWVPCTVERYIGALVALFITGIFTGFLKAVRARLEQRWMKQLRDEPPLPEGSWAFLPTGQQRWMNLMRFVFVFVTVTLDYALMLAAMTFNYGIFFAVILGMAAGSLFFGHTVVPIRTRSSKPTHQRLPLDTQTDGSETSSTSPDGDIVGTSIAVKSSGSSCCKFFLSFPSVFNPSWKPIPHTHLPPILPFLLLCRVLVVGVVFDNPERCQTTWRVVCVVW